MKKANDYVIPVELYIKFHYSVDYQYTFLAIIKTFYEMAPFGNGVKYNINQLLFLMTDNDKGQISEYSESFSTIMANYGFHKELEKDQIQKNISDIIEELDFNEFKRTR
jgi:hypothetical protein